MKIQVMELSPNTTWTFLYGDSCSNSVFSEFILFAKKVLEELMIHPSSSKFFVYLQHYRTNGSLISRGIDACKLLVTDKKHKAEVNFSIDFLRKADYEIHDDIMNQWSSYLSVTPSIPFEPIL